jgi:hypothetical protein
VTDFNPAEPRDLDGKWIKGLAHLAAAKKIAALPLGKKATIHGNPVRNLPGKGYRVRINDVGVNYKHPEDAARSMVAGKHMPASKHIAELENMPNKTPKQDQILHQLHVQELESLKTSGESSPGHAPSEQKQSQILKEVAAKQASGGKPNAPMGSEEMDQWEYDKGLVTAEEFFAAHGHVPNGSALTFSDLDQNEIMNAKQHLMAQAKGTASVKNAAEPITTLKSGKSVVGHLGGMGPATAQTAFNAGSLTTTEFFAKFGVLPDGAHTGILSMDLKVVNGLRKELGLPAFTQSDLKLKAKLATEKAAKAATSKATAEAVFDPKELPPGAPPGALIGPAVWDALPNFKPSNNSIKSGISNYTGSGYGSINQSLRKGLVSSSTASTVKKLDDAFKEVPPTKQDLVVYRGVSSHDIMFGTTGSHIGGVFLDGGFVSTTANTSTATSFGGSGAFIRIIIPKGSKVVKTAGISSHASEKEIILNRGSMFEIVSDTMQAIDTYGHVDKRRVVTLKLVS